MPEPDASFAREPDASFARDPDSAQELDLLTKPSLRGPLVTLRPFRDGDVEVMARILSEPEVRRLTGSVERTAEVERPQPLDDRLRDWYATGNEQSDRLDLAVADASTGRLVGEVVLNEVDPGAARATRGCSWGRSSSTPAPAGCTRRSVTSPPGCDRTHCSSTASPWLRSTCPWTPSTGGGGREGPRGRRRRPRPGR